MSFIVFPFYWPIQTLFSIYNATNHFPSSKCFMLILCFRFYPKHLPFWRRFAVFARLCRCLCVCMCQLWIFSYLWLETKTKINKHIKYFSFQSERVLLCAVRAWCCRAVRVQVKGKLSFQMWNGIVSIVRFASHIVLLYLVFYIMIGVWHWFPWFYTVSRVFFISNCKQL